METDLISLGLHYRIAVHPQLKGYSIGGEDGYVRVHQLSPFSRTLASSVVRRN